MLVCGSGTKIRILEFNMHHAETAQAMPEVCEEMSSPVILAGAPGTFRHVAVEPLCTLCKPYVQRYDMLLALHL